MTFVTFESYYDTKLFECTGHTEYALAGRDILCSAVSCLCYTLDAYLRGCEERGIVKNYVSDFNSGNVRIKFEYGDTLLAPFTEEAVQAILGGFVLLSENFPDHISVDI